jgi:hypothetical protein
MKIRAAALVVLPALLATALVVQLNVLAGRLAATAIPGPLCTTGALHTSEEPPELPLTRDYAVLRVMLKDPADQFHSMRQLYDGALRAPNAERSAAFLGKRSQRLTLAPHWRQFRSLRSEVERIDRDRGTRIAATIDRGFRERDRAVIEAGFRRMFAALLDEALAGIRDRLDHPGATRSFQYVRRFYSSGLEAQLALKSPASSLDATGALDGMRRALQTAMNSPDAVKDFDRERRKFLETLGDAVDL